MLKIIKATYGGKDVTGIVDSLISKDGIDILVGNAIFGDPQPFSKKYLSLEYSIDGNPYSCMIEEGQYFKVSAYMPYIPISCKCITYGRVNFLEESIESFLRQQYDGESELVIVNDYPKQKLIINHPRIRVYNFDFTFPTIGEKENFAVSACKYDTVAVWDDDDIALPNHLSNINKYFPGHDLLHWQNGIALVQHNIAALRSLGNSGIVYSKNIWARAGMHSLENAGYDTTFVNKAAKAGARIARAMPKNDEVSWCYNWGNGTYHMSGMGADDGTKPNVIIRHSEYIESLRKRGEIPEGDVLLSPHWERDYSKMLKEYVSNS